MFIITKTPTRWQNQTTASGKVDGNRWQSVIIELIKRGVFMWLSIYHRLPILKCLNTVCARSAIVLLTCISARTRLWEKQTWRLYSDHFISFSEDFASVFFPSQLSNSFLCVKNVLFSNVLKVILLENTLPFWECLHGSRKIENPVKCSACAVNQKIVTTRFSGNALVSTEPLDRILWNLVEQ